jgi:hypothetical protein
MAPKVKRLRDYDRKRKRERQQKLVQENVKGFATLSNPITAKHYFTVFQLQSIIKRKLRSTLW